MNTLEQFLSYIHCASPIAYTLYNENEEIIFPNREMNFLDEHLIAHHFSLIKETTNTLLILGAPLGINWAAIRYKEQIHVFGPVTEQLPSRTEINAALSDISLHSKRLFSTEIEELPTVPSTTFRDYSLMFYFAVTGKHTNVSDILFEKMSNTELSTLNLDEDEENLKNCWLCEQQIFEAVKNGHSQNIRKQIFQFHRIALRKLYPQNSIRNKKNLSLFILALCVRASVLGGLSISTAYALEAYYTQKLEETHDLSTLSSINLTFIEDFANRVHTIKLKTSSYSSFLIDLEEYILLNLEEELNLNDLAAEFEYTPYYLSRKYKEEKGISLSTFIKQARLKFACFLLQNTDKSISQISEQLHFGSISYFISEFRKSYHTTPSAFREKIHSL